jgi:hypothetical protein
MSMVGMSIVITKLKGAKNGCVTIESVKISFYPHAHTSNH